MREPKPKSPSEIVAAFWRAMAGNNFHQASLWLTEDFICDWPQSGERIVGRLNFAEINSAYPAAGPWLFDVRRMLADGAQVVTETAITDGETEALAITFHEVAGGMIRRQVEYWPDPYAPPAWRAAWVTRMPAETPS